MINKVFKRHIDLTSNNIVPNPWTKVLPPFSTYLEKGKVMTGMVKMFLKMMNSALKGRSQIYNYKRYSCLEIINVMNFDLNE